MDQKIIIGSIVQVPHLRSMFSGKQGVVVDINENGDLDGPVGVKFPPWYRDLFGMFDDKEQIIRFQFDELRLVKAFDPIPLEDYMKILFGDMAVWVIYEPKFPLIPGQTKCSAKGCEEMAYFLIWINCQGAVVGQHVCGNHTHHHGCCMDSLPEELTKT